MGASLSPKRGELVELPRRLAAVDGAPRALDAGRQIAREG